MNNSKSYLNEYTQKKHSDSPVYHTENSGNGFSCTVTIEETQFSSLSSHSTKKEAENDAAGVAVQAIIRNEPNAKNFEDVLKTFENSKNKQKKTAVGPEFDTVVTNTNSALSRSLPSQPLPTTGNVLAIHTPTKAQSPGMVYSVQPATQSMPCHPILVQSPGHVYNVPPTSQPLPRHHNVTQSPGNIVCRASQLMPRSPILGQSPGQVCNVHPTTQSVPQYPTPAQYMDQYPATPYVYSTLRGTPHNDLQQTSLRSSLATASTLPMHPKAVPYGGPLGTNLPTEISARIEVPLEFINHSPQLYSQTPVNLSKIPLSVIGPSIGDLPSPNIKDKPCNAIPFKPFPGLHSSIIPAPTHPIPLRVEHQNPPSSGESTVIPSESIAGDVRDLEEYCKALNLPKPVFSISTDNQKIFVGKVKVGEKEFSRQWKYASFNDAKESAAIVATASLAMTQLRDSLLTGSVEALKLSSGSKQSSNRSPGFPSNLSPGQVRILQRTQPSFSTTESPKPKTAPLSISPVVAGLQTPSFFQQPLSAKGGGDVLSPYLQPSQEPQGSNNTVTSNVQYPSQQSLSFPIMPVNLKSQLNEYCQKRHILPPVYECSYPDDAVGYVVSVTINGKLYKSEAHKTKRAAEEDVARMAMGALSINIEDFHEPVRTRKQVPSETFSSNPPAANISYKNLLQEKAQKERVATPRYVTEKIENEEVFGFVSTVTVYLPSGQSLHKSSSSRHTGKKTAEQEAAKLACAELNLF